MLYYTIHQLGYSREALEFFASTPDVICMITLHIIGFKDHWPYGLLGF